MCEKSAGEDDNPVGIQITPEMIRRGVEAYREWESSEGEGCWDDRVMVKTVVLAVLGRRALLDWR